MVKSERMVDRRNKGMEAPRRGWRKKTPIPPHVDRAIAPKPGSYLSEVYKLYQEDTNTNEIPDSDTLDAWFFKKGFEIGKKYAQMKHDELMEEQKENN